jgi:hypothetical protein
MAKHFLVDLKDILFEELEREYNLVETNPGGWGRGGTGNSTLRLISNFYKSKFKRC